MKHILIDYAREQKAAKRNWGKNVELESHLVRIVEGRLANIGLATRNALENVLDALEWMKIENPELVKIVELSVFCIMGLTRQTYERRKALAIGDLKRIMNVIAAEADLTA